MAIKKIGVVGAGTMGRGIAQVAAASGFEVVLNDVADDLIQRSLKIVDKSLAKLSEKGKIEEDKDKIISRIKTTTQLADIKDVDFAVEAVFEDFEVKKKLIGELDKILDPSVILTTNTSSISITRLAALTSRPDKFMGMHFMNPVPLMTLVELDQRSRLCLDGRSGNRGSHRYSDEARDESSNGSSDTGRFNRPGCLP